MEEIRSVIKLIASSTITKIFASTGIVTASLSYLIKTWTGHKLKILQARDQIRFSKLHEEQAQAIKELYSYFLEVKRDCSRIIKLSEYKSPDESHKNEELKKIREKNQIKERQSQFFQKNEILFSERICKLMNEIWSDSQTIKLHEIFEFNDDTLMYAKGLEEKMDKALIELKEEFRKIRGVK